MLYEAFGWEIPKFYHVPLITDNAGKKISKRKKYDYPIFPLSGEYISMPEKEHVSVKGFKEYGYLPEALLNAISLIGWTPKNTSSDIFSMEEAIASFELSDIHKSDAKFDINKLKFINKEYLKKKDLNYLYSFMDKGNTLVYNDEKLRLIADVALERSNFAHELNNAVDYFFNGVNYDNVKIKNADLFIPFVDKFLMALKINTDFSNTEAIDNSIVFSCESLNIEKGKILPDLRNALTGGKSGTHICDTMMILGIDETVNRICNYVSFLFKTQKVNA